MAVSIKILNNYDSALSLIRVHPRSVCTIAQGACTKMLGTYTLFIIKENWEIRGKRKCPK